MDLFSLFEYDFWYLVIYLSINMFKIYREYFLEIQIKNGFVTINRV